MADQDEVLGIVFVVQQFRTFNSCEFNGHASRVWPPARSRHRVTIGEADPSSIFATRYEYAVLQAWIEVRVNAEYRLDASIVESMRVAASEPIFQEAFVNSATDNVDYFVGVFVLEVLAVLVVALSQCIIDCAVIFRG